MNVLFNLLRGGTVADGYTIKRADFLEFCQSRNRMVAQRLAAAFDAESPALPETLTLQALKTWAAESKCPDYQRLALEYLPITFSRRHGDPSRPWNQFDIKIHNADGSPHLYYEGNWRDIFQNWEALSLAYPGFIESMICKFLNATTADGYNPYRLTSLESTGKHPILTIPGQTLATGAITKSFTCSNSSSCLTIYILMASRICC